MILSPKQIEFYSKISPDALKELAYGSAAVGSGMVPGGGIADYVGALPDPSQKGEYSPSFMENIEKKQYVDAALQGLSVFGDMAMASAPVTGGAGIPIGMVAKGLSTAGKLARSEPKLLTKGKAKVNLDTSEPEKPLRLFHGTTRDFEGFDPDAEMHYFSPDPEEAGYYTNITSLGGKADKGGRIIPVYLKDANYFDVDNPEHLKILEQSDFYKDNARKLFIEEYKLGSDETYDNLLEVVEDGDYNVLERLAPELKKLGFDGHTTYEANDKNYAVYDTDLIVSGIEKKAGGGEARTSGIGTLHMTARNMFRPMVS